MVGNIAHNIHDQSSYPLNSTHEALLDLYSDRKEAADGKMRSENRRNTLVKATTFPESHAGFADVHRI